MEFCIERNELLNGLTKIQSIVEKKSTMPIISNVLFDVTDSRLCLIGTDLEVILKTEHPAEVVDGGRMTVSARKIYEIVREIPHKNLTIKEKEGSRLNIFSGSINYTLLGLPADQFPSLPDYEDINLVEIDSNSLKELINKTIFSVALEETRFNLCGINVERIESENGIQLRMVASDGHRLSLMEAKLEGIEKIELNSGVILPRKGAREILRICEANDKLSLGFKEKICLIKAGNIVLIMRLIDAEYPDYKSIIPSGGSKKVVVERQSLLNALRRTAIVATDKYKAVSFTLSEGKLGILSVNPDVGDAKEELDVDYSGEQFNINFNMHYLLENMEVMASDHIVLELDNESSPCLIKGAEDEGFLGIIMPMRV